RCGQRSRIRIETHQRPAHIAEATGRNDVARESNAGNRVLDDLAGLQRAEVAILHGRCGNSRRLTDCGGQTQSLIAEKEKGLVFPYRSAKRAAELVATELRN